MQTVTLEEVRGLRLLPGGRLSRADAAAYLGKKPRTLAFWAVAGVGPRQIKIGGRSFYEVAELERWIAEGAAEPSGAAA